MVLEFCIGKRLCSWWLLIEDSENCRVCTVWACIHLPRVCHIVEKRLSFCWERTCTHKYALWLTGVVSSHIMAQILTKSLEFFELTEQMSGGQNLFIQALTTVMMVHSRSQDRAFWWVWCMQYCLCLMNLGFVWGGVCAICIIGCVGWQLVLLRYDQWLLVLDTITRS